MFSAFSAFSARTDLDRTTHELASALAKRRGSGAEVLDLTESNPTRAQIPYAARDILQALARPEALVYEPEPFGLHAAREHVAREAGVDASRIVLTASTSEAYAFVFKLLCDPGDDVLVPQPSYPLFDMLARFESVRLVPYRLAYDGAWHVDLDSVRRAIGARTRAILVVHPNNPTGSFLSRAELDALAATGLPIVSDEVFASYGFSASPDPRRADSAALARGASLVFALGGLSKLAALPQMKLAWMALGGEPSRVSEAMARLELVADAFLSVSTPVQHALPGVLASRARAADAIRARTKENLAKLEAMTAGSAATLLRVEGGWYATLRLPATKSEHAWALEVLEQDGVYVHPGSFFGFESEPFVVLSLLTPAPTFERGSKLLLARVAA
jgi:aspartate/methionine/tyrosine aminotransferase